MDEAVAYEQGYREGRMGCYPFLQALIDNMGVDRDGTEFCPHCHKEKPDRFHRIIHSPDCIVELAKVFIAESLK